MIRRNDEIASRPRNAVIDRNDAQNRGAGDGEIFEEATRSEPPNTDTSAPETLLDFILEGMQMIWNQVLQFLTVIVSELHIYELFDASVIWCVRNPKWAVVLIIAGLVFVMPFLIVLCFAIATMILTFTGILVLEGTLFTVVSMLFFGCVSFLAFFVLFLVGVAVCIYLGFAHLYDFYGGMERYRQSIMAFAEKQREATTRRQEVMRHELQDGRRSQSRSNTGASVTRRAVAQPRE